MSGDVLILTTGGRGDTGIQWEWVEARGAALASCGARDSPTVKRYLAQSVSVPRSRNTGLYITWLIGRVWVGLEGQGEETTLGACLSQSWLKSRLEKVKHFLLNLNILILTGKYSLVYVFNLACITQYYSLLVFMCISHIVNLT